MKTYFFREKRLIMVDGSANNAAPETQIPSAPTPLLMPNLANTVPNIPAQQVAPNQANAQKPAVPEAAPAMPQMPVNPEAMKPVTLAESQKLTATTIEKADKRYQRNNSIMDTLSKVKVDEFKFSP